MIHIISDADLIIKLVKAKTIGIIGYPSAGKTTLGLKLKKATNRRIIHTDDYLKIPHDERPEAIFKDLAGSPYIIEGNEVTRLLNRGLNLDLVVMVVGTNRNDKSLNGLKGRVDKFLKEYKGDVYSYNWRPAL